LKDLRLGRCQFHVTTTNTLYHGLDIPRIFWIINYDMAAIGPEDFVHQVGCCARFGKEGISISFIIPEDQPTLNEIQAHYLIQLKELPKEVAHPLVDEIDFS
jgi:superfamily II DNA/RNA helicase